ncbi:hypothetical protein [Streptomyces sp. NPDC002159]
MHLDQDSGGEAFDGGIGIADRTPLSREAVLLLPISFFWRLTALDQLACCAQKSKTDCAA